MDMKINKDILKIRWSEGDEALLFIGESPTAGLLSYVFECIYIHGNKTFAEELSEAGYDIKTLKFSIKKKKDDAL